MSIFPGPSSDSRARFSLACALVWLSLALAGARVDAQLSSALGGDLAGRPSQARVVRLNGLPVANVTPTSGDVLKWNGTTYTPDVDQVGDVSEPLLALLWTASPTQTHTIVGSGSVTLASIPIEASDCVTYRRFDVLLGGTCNITSNSTHRINLFLNGRPLHVGLAAVVSASVNPSRYSVATSLYFSPLNGGGITSCIAVRQGTLTFGGGSAGSAGTNHNPAPELGSDGQYAPSVGTACSLEVVLQNTTSANIPVWSVDWGYARVQRL